MKFSTVTKNTAVPTLAFVGLFALCCSSCDPTGIDKKVVCEVAPYADLAFLVADVIEPGAGTVAKLILNTTIQNVQKECRRMAEASNSKTNAFYRADANAAWQQTQFNQNGNLTYDVIVPRQH